MIEHSILEKLQIGPELVSSYSILNLSFGMVKGFLCPSLSIFYLIYLVLIQECHVSLSPCPQCNASLTVQVSCTQDHELTGCDSHSVLISVYSTMKNDVNWRGSDVWLKFSNIFGIKFVCVCVCMGNFVGRHLIVELCVCMLAPLVGWIKYSYPLPLS